MMSMFARLKGHFQEYVARYSVLALAVLVPLSGALGSLAADLGGSGTSAGRIAVGAASALGTAIAGVTFIRNLGIWQMLDRFGTAPLVPKAEAPNVVAGGDVTVEASGRGGDAPTTVSGSGVDPGSSPESPPDAGVQVPGEGAIVPDEDAQEELESSDGLVAEGDTPESEATV